MVHDLPHAAVFEVTGAGTQGLAWLHAAAGSSRTVLEATDRYNIAALTDALGDPPRHAVSVEVAQRLAARARARALQLLGEGESQPAVGVSATATIATDRPKRGRRGAALAVETGLGVASLSLGFDEAERPGLREHEEAVVSALLLGLLAEGCGIDAVPLVLSVAGVDAGRAEQALAPAPELSALLAGDRDAVAAPASGRTDARAPLPAAGAVIVSGAFDPWHQGHRALGAAAAAVAAAPPGAIWYELPIINADKAPLLPREAWRRAAQFAGTGNLLLSRAPLFHDKALLYPGATFVVGADTAERLVQPRFYGDSERAMELALGEIEAAGCHFVVACRTAGPGRGLAPGRSSTTSAAPLCLEDLHLPQRFAGLFTSIPVESFRMDVSSTEIRQATAAEWHQLTS